MLSFAFCNLFTLLFFLTLNNDVFVKGTKQSFSTMSSKNSRGKAT